MEGTSESPRSGEEKKIVFGGVVGMRYQLKVNLRKQKVVREEMCIFCGRDPETVEHPLLDCPRSVSIWFSSVLGLCIRRD